MKRKEMTRAKKVAATKVKKSIGVDETREVDGEMHGFPSNVIESFDSPESSNISSAAYDPEKQHLSVSFKSHTGGTATRVYSYSGVSPALWREFVQAKSKGKFFAEAIRPMFAGVPVWS